MRKKLFLTAAALVGAALASPAKADTYNLQFWGPGIHGSLVLTYGTATDAKYSQALEITGVSGTFTDTNNGLNIVDETVTGLQAITHDTPEPTNLLAPDDFSRFAVATGLDPLSGGYLTYDNLLWLTGAPQTASDYAASGGIVDIYGLMFTLNNGDNVDFWSNGTFVPGGPFDYGVGVANSATALNYQGSGVNLTPEPASVWLMATGLLALGVVARRRLLSDAGR